MKDTYKDNHERPCHEANKIIQITKLYKYTLFYKKKKHESTFLVEISVYVQTI